jgi:hypothetical protein
VLWRASPERHFRGPACERGTGANYGTRTPLPDGRDSRTYLARLTELEAQAKAARRVEQGAAVKYWEIIADNLSEVS